MLKRNQVIDSFDIAIAGFGRVLDESSCQSIGDQRQRACHPYLARRTSARASWRVLVAYMVGVVSRFQVESMEGILAQTDPCRSIRSMGLEWEDRGGAPVDLATA